METRLTASVTGPIFRAVPHLLGFPSRRFRVDYDAEADVLYISLERSQQATDGVMTDDGVLLRYRKDRLVGVTILEASAREEHVDPTCV